MTAGRRVVAIVLSLVFPGFGHGLLERRWRMAAFAAGDLLATISVLQNVWGLVVSAAIRIIAAGDTFWYSRKYEGREGSWGWAAVAVLVGAIGIGFSSFTMEGFGIPSESMVPTLDVGDQVYVDKLSLAWRKPERGEVLVFLQPCAKRPYVKRVIGLAGDSIEVRCGVVHINGEPIARLPAGTGRFRELLGGHAYVVPEDLQHDFPLTDVMIPPSCVQGQFYDKPDDQPEGKLVESVPRGTAGRCELQLHFVVPPSSIFVMGDNRNNANDSRFWGVVQEKAIIGRVIGRVAPWSRFGAIE